MTQSFELIVRFTVLLKIMDFDALSHLRNRDVVIKKNCQKTLVS